MDHSHLNATAILDYLRRYGYFDFTKFYTPFLFLDTWLFLAFFLLVSVFFFVQTQRGRNLGEKNTGFRAWLRWVVTKEDMQKKSFWLDVQWYALRILNFTGGVTSFFFFLFSMKRLPALLAHFSFYESHLSLLLRSWLGAMSPTGQGAFLFLGLLILNDLGAYIIHRLQHTFEFLWIFHKIHHYPTQMNFFAAARSHPLDALLFESFPPVFSAFFLSLFLKPGPHFLDASTFASEGSLLYLFGITLPELFIKFHHTKFPIGYGRFLEKFFISPKIHIVHHAYEIPNKNFGGILAIWDHLFGTFYAPKTIEERDHIVANLGVPGIPDGYYQNIITAICFPFLEAVKMVMSWFHSGDKSAGSTDGASSAVLSMPDQTSD